MNTTQKADAARTFLKGTFSIKEVAAYVGAPEFAVADFLIQSGALRRRSK